MRFLFAILLLFPLGGHVANAAEPQDYDVVVYGGTPSGIAAAIAAKRDGASVVLLEQTRHVGGLSTSGLNRDETEHMDRATFGGICKRFLNEAAFRSGCIKDRQQPGVRQWHSRFAEQVFLEMLEKASVPVRNEQLISSVLKQGASLRELRVRNGNVYRAKVFIDATYEGDLMAKAEVDYALGRESRDEYGEPIAVVRYLDKPVKVSPFDSDGQLLLGVMPGGPPKEFTASPHPLCYNVRLNLTDNPENRVPIGQPENYDPQDFELLARTIEAGHVTSIGNVLGFYTIRGTRKRECNNGQFSYVSMSMPGEQTDWCESSFEQREVIHQRYRDYTQGIIWFLKTDPRVPQKMRDRMATYGLCKDEWTDNGHWPWYLYIRAGRRMKGVYVMTQHDITRDVDKSDVVHIGSHFIDSHHVTRYAVDGDHFINEGRIWEKGKKFDFPYRAITPRAEQCNNLLVPVAVSASNLAFCTIRLEPTWMHLGEVAGMAAVIAIDDEVDVQKVDLPRLQQRIRKAGIPLEK